MHAARNAGKGSAIREGLRHATGSIVAIQDADLELDPAQLAALVQPILTGQADVVYGSRFLGGRSNAPFVTSAANRVLTTVTNLLFGGSLTDMETCYKVMRLEVARSLRLTAERFDIEPQITARLLRGGHPAHLLRIGAEVGLRDAGGYLQSRPRGAQHGTAISPGCRMFTRRSGCSRRPRRFCCPAR